MDFILLLFAVFLCQKLRSLRPDLFVKPYSVRQDGGFITIFPLNVTRNL